MSDLQSIASGLRHLDGADLLRPLLEEFKGRTALVSSFGAESAVLLHMVSEIDRAVPIMFIDTGKLFWETRYYRSKLVDRLGLTDVRTLRPLAGDIARQDPQGDLHKRDTDRCCHIRKTLPLERALSGFNAWISGRKRFHGGARGEIETVEIVDGRLKADPLALMGRGDLEAYFTVFDLPRHPLVDRGYPSIGCAPCTRKAADASDPRGGRWAGSDKTECGIHWGEDGRPIRLGEAA
jgi:phosphoadenosine phosphosulfate reductase